MLKNCAAGPSRLATRTAQALRLSLAASLLVTGCATVPFKGGFSEVEAIVGGRLDKDIHWFQGTPEDAEVATRVAALLEGELSLDAAVQIALLNSRSLQARYEDLGVAQADLVQAGLLGNPVFFASARSAGDGSPSTNTELGVVQDFLDVLLRPARKRISSLELEQAKLRVAQSVLVHAAEVKGAYYTLQASMQVADMLRVIVRAAGAASELARRQHAAGNLNDLDLASRQAVLVAPGQTRDIEFVATAGDWAMHCHKRHHPMNAMGHDIPNVLGVDQSGVEQEIQSLLPGYMAMGETGMEEHSEYAAHMEGPPNTLPMMGGDGPFGSIGMGGMFTILKVRDRLDDSSAEGWYDNPPGTVSESVENR